jgi:hypothetical protein
MKFTTKLACLTLIVPALLSAAATGSASASNCTSADICSYTINGAGFDPADGSQPGGTPFTITFSTLGPEQFNEAPNTLLSFSVNGAPAAGWVLDTSNFGQTSYGPDGAIFATFDDDSEDGSTLSPVTYEFFGSDQFWATTGTQDFGTTYFPGPSGGAIYDFNTSGPQAVPSDPPCTGCTVSLTATSVPEAGSAAQLVTFAGIGMVALLLRRKQRKLAD